MVLQQLAEASTFEAEEYFPVSGVTGEGVEALIDYLESRMPKGHTSRRPSNRPTRAMVRS